MSALKRRFAVLELGVWEVAKTRSWQRTEVRVWRGKTVPEGEM